MTNSISVRLIDRDTGELVAHGRAPQIGPATLWHTNKTDEEGGVTIPPFKVYYGEAIDAWVIVTATHVLHHELGNEVPAVLGEAARVIQSEPIDDMHGGGVLVRPAAAIPDRDRALDHALEVLRGLEYTLEVDPDATGMYTQAFAELADEYGIWEGPGKPEDE